LIYDCILYSGERELLEIRLNETSLCGDWVTTVIVEATKTHTGWEKPLYFEEHKQQFKRFNIFYLAIYDMPDNCTAREREKYQRNKIITALKFVEPQPHDTVIISDIDEVPRAKQVNKFINSGIDFAALIQDKYAYFLNCLESEQSWDRSRIMRWGYLRNKTPEEVRNSGYDFSINDAGWHWSWVIDPLRKLESFSHTELNTQENIERVEKKENIWNDDKFKIIDINLSHPEYLFKNQHLYKHLIK
jgi:hypothetical protein